MSQKITNNYPKLQADFKQDTGMDASTHFEEFIQYFNSRIYDREVQINEIFNEKLLDTINSFHTELEEFARSFHTIAKSLRKEN